MSTIPDIDETKRGTPNLADPSIRDPQMKADGTPAPITEAYPVDGEETIDPRATGGGGTGGFNPDNPGRPSQGYKGQGMDAPRSDAQVEMEKGGDATTEPNASEEEE